MGAQELPQGSPDPELEQQMEALRRGTVEIIREEDLRQKLVRSREKKTPLRIKLTRSGSNSPSASPCARLA